MTIINTRDILLQATSPRLIDPGNLGITISASSYVFRFTDDLPETEAASVINLSAISTVSGLVEWSIVGTPTGITLTAAGSTCIVEALGSMPDTVEIEAKITSILFGKDFTRRVTLARVLDGASGTSGDSVDIIFVRSLTQPATPTASAGVPAGWYSDVASVPSTPTGGAIWSSTGQKSAAGSTYIWGVPVRQSGTAIVELIAYIRSTTDTGTPAPSTPTGGTYNFSTNVFTPPAGWSIGFPPGTNPIYTSRAVVSTGDPSTSVVATGWTTPVLTLKNGTNGTDATVTAANVAAAIQANSGTPITMTNSNLFQTAASGPRVFIGAGGITATTGVAGSDPTFYLDASTGNSFFRGQILGNSSISITGNANNPILVYGLANSKANFTTCAAFNTVNISTQIGVVGLTQKTDAVAVGVYGESTSLTNGDSAGVGGVGYYGVFGRSTTDIGAGVLAKGSSNNGTCLLIQQGNFISQATNFTLTSNGTLTTSGNVTAFSDKRIKTNILRIVEPISKIKRISGYQYKNLLAKKLDCGIIAQEVEKILPELVEVSTKKVDGEFIKTVNYNGLIALLVEVTKTLVDRVELLEDLNDFTSYRSNKS